eukprot:SAG31_NODE_5413_length_2550_cov_2.164831_1_plen_731_part_00
MTEVQAEKLAELQRLLLLTDLLGDGDEIDAEHADVVVPAHELDRVAVEINGLLGLGPHDEYEGSPVLVFSETEMLDAAIAAGLLAAGDERSRSWIARWFGGVGVDFGTDADRDGGEEGGAPATGSEATPRVMLLGALLRHISKGEDDQNGREPSDAVKRLLSGEALRGANLQEVDLRGANLQGADLRGANLQGADLYEANLQGANLREANLQGANLDAANLQEADFSAANLLGAVLTRANLQGADFTRANLQGAYLDGANLQGANLRYADLSKVKVSRNTSFRGAKLQDANLDGAINLELAQFDPMPPLAKRRRAAAPAPWPKRLALSLLSQGGDEDDADEEDDDEAGEDDADEAGADDADDAGADDDAEQNVQNPIVVHDVAVSLEEFKKLGEKDLEEALKTRLKELGDEKLAVLSEKLTNADDTKDKLLASLCKLEFRLKLIKAKKKRKELHKTVIDKLPSKLKSKAVFILRTAPLTAFYDKLYSDTDHSPSEEERNTFAKLLADWFAVAEAIEPAKRDRAQIHRYYHKMTTGELVFDPETLADGKPRELDKNGSSKLPQTVIDERKTRAAVHKTETALGAPSKYTTTGWVGMVRAVLAMDTVSMNVDLKELVFLLEELKVLRDPISASNWDDALDTWLSLAELPRKFRGDRSQMVLKQIFLDQELKTALGMANQLRDIVRGENNKSIPQGLVTSMKNDAGGHIKAHYYSFVKAINSEIERINRIKAR